MQSVDVLATSRPPRDWQDVYAIKAMCCQVTITLIVLASLTFVPSMQKVYFDYKLKLPLATQLLLGWQGSYRIIIISLAASSVIAAMAPYRTNPIATRVVRIVFWLYLALATLGLIAALLPLVKLCEALT
jgi:type II secretory pathway component PulF